MKFKILGSGTSVGIPMIGCNCKVCKSDNPKNKRLRTSAMITTDQGQNIIIDTGPDFRYQMLKFGIENIDAVIYTHSHADHILGIDDLRGYNFSHKKPINCYATKKTLDEIKAMFHYIPEDIEAPTHSSTPKLIFNTFNFEPFQLCGIEIQPFQLVHGKMEVAGFKIGNLAYATDCNFISEETIKLLSGVPILILDALRPEYKPKSHFLIHESVEVAQRISAQKTYLIHMSHEVEHDEWNNSLPEGIELAYDGLELEI